MEELAQPFGFDELKFRDCFTAPSLRLFSALIVGWVLQVGRHTITEVMQAHGLHESRHFSGIYRFLSRAKWCTDQVACVVFRLLVESLIPEDAEILIVIDDTLNRHGGQKICGAGRQYDGAAARGSKRMAHGVCFVLIGLVVRLPDISDRIFCLPFAARLWWPEKAKLKPKGSPYKTKPELGL
jgi:SRSO17 transposase